MEPLSNATSGKKFPTRQIFEFAVQFLALAILFSFSYRILEPFITPMIWASILAITLYPFHQGLTKKMGGRKSWSAVIITLLMLLIFIVPAIWLGFRTINEIRGAREAFQQGELHIPPPPEKVKGWPLVGNKVFVLWSQASSELGDLIKAYPEKAKALVSKGFSTLGTLGTGILLFAAAIVICGVLLNYSKSAAEFAERLVNRLVENSHQSLPEMAAVTVRKVVKGILGVALIQSALATAGMMIGGIPAAGIWGLVCVVLAITQISILPVSIGVIIYIWNTGSTTSAILLTIWMLIVGLLDNVLKPILLGKGAPAPMLIVFLGAIGGFILSGFVGLFTGAVILTLAYKIFDAWISNTSL